MHKKGYEEYKGARDDTLNVKVRGVLPGRTTTWRSGANDDPNADPGTREKLQWDKYTETSVAVTFGGNAYSAVHVTDEQAEMDFGSYTELLNPQAEAVGRGLEAEAAAEVEGAPYNVVLAPQATNHATFVEARRCLNLLRAPAEQRIMLVGSSFEAELLNDDKFNRADSVGEAAANTALRQATIRNWMGFTVISSLEIDPDTAYAFVPSAFVFISGAPAVPASVPFGATASHNGIAMRWLRDYDSEYQRDRSVVNTWYGFQSTKDSLVGPGNLTGTEIKKVDDVFVRGIKIDLNAATSTYPTG